MLDSCTLDLVTKELSQNKHSISYIKVHMATKWTIRHGLMLLWFIDLSGDLCKSGPGHFASEQSFPLNFVQ